MANLKVLIIAKGQLFQVNRLFQINYEIFIFCNYFKITINDKLLMLTDKITDKIKICSINDS